MVAQVSIERFVLSTRFNNPDDVTPLDAQEIAIWNETQHLVRASGARLSLVSTSHPGSQQIVESSILKHVFNN